MKKFLIFLVPVILLSGCKNTGEVGNNYIVSVFYTDYTKENIFEIHAETQDKNMVSAYGKSIDDAFSNLMENFENIPYFGHTSAIVIGEGMCKNCLWDTVNFFLKSNIVAPNTNVYLTADNFSDFEPLLIDEKTDKNKLPKCPIYTLFLPKNKTIDVPVINGVGKSLGVAVLEDFSFKNFKGEN